jgi:threonine dehydrogenase-like Zn-dependent dehydrogenase
VTEVPPSRTLAVPEPGRLAWVEAEERPLTSGRFRVETLFSGLSAGTELTFLKGTNPYLHASWDPEWGVFRADRPATGYPVLQLGYMEVGRVTDSRTPAVAEGALVAMAYGHRTSHVADGDTERFILLPDDVDPLLGVYVAHMGPICANGLLHAAAEARDGAGVGDLGDGVRGLTVLVTGAGVVGLLVAAFARHLGAAEVVVADPTPARRAAAEGIGLVAVDDGEEPLWHRIKQRWRHGPGDRGADVVFQCRGQAAVLAEALRCLRPQGTVIDLAFYPGGADPLRLGEEFHHNGLGIRCAQIGRVPRGLAHRWDRDRLSRATIDLLRAHGEAIRAHLVTDVVSFAEAPELMAAVAARRRHVIQAVFAAGTSAIRPSGRPGGPAWAAARASR